MFLFDLMKTSVLTRWLDRISRLHLPLEAGAVVRTGLVFVSGAHDRDWLQPADAATAFPKFKRLCFVVLFVLSTCL